MADNELAVKITADANQAKQEFDKAGAAVSALGDIIGLQVPDSVQKLLAQTDLVGPALSKAFAPLAVIELGKAILEAVIEERKHHEEIARLTEDATGAAQGIGQLGESLRITNLRLQDEINTLQKKPAVNGVAIILGEAAEKANQLRDAIQGAIDKEFSLLGEIAQGDIARLIDKSTIGVKAIANDLKDGVQQYQRELANLNNKIVLDQAEHNETELKADQTKYREKLNKYVEFLGQKQTALTNYKEWETTALQQDSLDEYYGGTTPGYSPESAARVAEGETHELQSALNTLRATALNAASAFSQLKNNTSLNVTKDYLAAGAALQNWVDVATQAPSKIAPQIKKTADDQAAADAEAAEALSRYFIDLAKGAEKQLQWDNQRTKAAEHIDQLQRDIVDHQAEHNAKMAVALGYMTQEQAAQQALKQLEADKKQALDEINSRLNAQIALLKRLSDETLGGLTGSDQQRTAFRQAVTDYQNMKIQQLGLEKKYDAQIEREQLKLTNTLTAQLRKQMLQWQQVHQQMGQLFLQTLNTMNQNLASFITTGQANWRQLASSAIEEIIKIGLQWVESHVIMALMNKLFGQQEEQQGAEETTTTIAQNVSKGISAAGLTFANTMASASLEDPWTAPEIAGANLAVALGALPMVSSAGGQWEVPGIQSTILHPQEMVLPASLASRIRNVIDNGGGSGHGGGITVVVNHSVSAIDADSFHGMIKKHSNMIGNEVARTLRKKGFGT